MPPDHDTLSISAPVNAMMEGVFQSHRTLAEVRRHGDPALGTLNHLDGEMVVLGGLTTDFSREMSGDLAKAEQEQSPLSSEN